MCYVPVGTASEEYLRSCGGALVSTEPDELKTVLCRAVSDLEFRKEWAERAFATGLANHAVDKISCWMREETEVVLANL